MSDSGEKKHPASAKKLRDQRKKGQVAQSQDVAKLLVLTAISEIALFTAETSLQRFQQLMLLPMSRLTQPFARALEEVLFEGLVMFFSFALLMAGVAIATKLISSWMQFGLGAVSEHLSGDQPVRQAMGVRRQRDFASAEHRQLSIAWGAGTKRVLARVVMRHTTACHRVSRRLASPAYGRWLLSSSSTRARQKRNRRRCQTGGSTHARSSCKGSSAGNSVCGGRALAIRLHHR